jgi:hypothetical protein
MIGLNKSMAQKIDSLEYIQFSGTVVTEGEGGKVIPLGYTNVSIKGTSRGTASEIDGFFSLVAKRTDVIIFSRIGYKTVEYAIPDSLENNLYYWIQIMSQDSILLPEAVIRPFPSREHFKIELLALDISDELEQQYSEYLAAELLDEIRTNLPADGREATNLYLRQSVENYKYEGQIKPQNIFNPIAWKQFIDAWKRGDFKKKKKK